MAAGRLAAGRLAAVLTFPRWSAVDRPPGQTAAGQTAAGQTAAGQTPLKVFPQGTDVQLGSVRPGPAGLA